jgi:hypothetical protein
MSHIREDVLFKDSESTQGQGILSSRESRRRRMQRLAKLGIDQAVLFAMYAPNGEIVGYQKLAFRRSGALLVFEHLEDVDLEFNHVVFPPEPELVQEAQETPASNIIDGDFVPVATAGTEETAQPQVSEKGVAEEPAPQGILTDPVVVTTQAPEFTGNTTSDPIADETSRAASSTGKPARASSAGTRKAHGTAKKK